MKNIKILAVVLVVSILLIACQSAKKETAAKIDREALFKKALEQGPIIPRKELTINWPINGAIQYYNKETLFEYINGEAELFFPYGFKKLSAVDYVYSPDPNQTLTIDVYEMGSPFDAFGVFSQMKNPIVQPVKVGVEGFISDNIMCFYKDRYFVQITGEAQGALKERNLMMGGTIMDELTPGVKSEPAELNLLNFEGKIRGTEKYNLSGLLGYDFLKPVLWAKYKEGDEQGRGFVILPQKSKAVNIVKEYGAFLASQGNADSIKTIGAGMYEVEDPNYGKIILGQKKGYTFGAVQFKNKMSGIKLVQGLMGKVQ